MLIANANTALSMTIDRLWNIHDRLRTAEQGLRGREFGEGISQRVNALLARENRVLAEIKRLMDVKAGRPRAGRAV